jgi:hypothetical protein
MGLARRKHRSARRLTSAWPISESVIPLLPRRIIDKNGGRQRWGLASPSRTPLNQGGFWDGVGGHGFCAPGTRIAGNGIDPTSRAGKDERAIQPVRRPWAKHLPLYGQFPAVPRSRSHIAISGAGQNLTAGWDFEVSKIGRRRIRVCRYSCRRQHESLSRSLRWDELDFSCPVLAKELSFGK